jgi:hypothetical protein
MAKRGFSEKNYCGANPLPDISDAEILERAGLDVMEPKDMGPFTLDWKYAPGPDREFARLKPGDYLILRESERQMFLTELADLGAVVYPHGADPFVKATAELKGLRRAMEHFGRQGNTRLIELRKTHGLTKEEMDDYKYDHWAYYYNQARADVLKEAVTKKTAEIEDLKAEGRLARKKTGDSDAESETSVE